MNHHLPPPSPQARFRESINDLRVVGGLFFLLGFIPLFVAITSPTRAAQLLLAGAGILLTGPGVWYELAARHLRRRQMWIIRFTVYVALAQVVAVLGLVLLGLLLRSASAEYFALRIPVMLLCFFIPAVVALVWNLRRLETLAATLLPTETAFQPVTAQKVEPVEPPLDPNGESDEPAPQR